ncbi:MAG TPA: phosphoribosylglycinamide formyltransferase [Polyangiaceae bacterium]|nr:phosphoribosylglycinamide formyltransferase [Polyangiaceae bacterium]
MATLPLGILVSGSGTNLQAVLDAVASRQLDADVRLVVSNKPGVGALARAQRAGVPCLVLPYRTFPDRIAFERALVEALSRAGARWIVLAGFMRVLGPAFLDAFPGRVVNIHPSLLPAFPGVDAQRQALEYGVRVSGCTTHFVDAGTDTGPIIAQSAVPVLPDDTRDSLAARILPREHELLVRTLQWIADERVQILDPLDGRRPRVVLRGVEDSPPMEAS